MPHQAAGRKVIRSGCLMVLAGLVYGLTVHDQKYPRLALAAHIQFMTEGVLSVVAGLLLVAGPKLCAVPGWAARIIMAGHFSLWPQVGSECLAAHYGTSFLQLAAKAADAGPAPPHIDNAIAAMHIGPGLFIMLSWALLVWGVFAAPTDDDASKKSK